MPVIFTSDMAMNTGALECCQGIVITVVQKGTSIPAVMRVFQVLLIHLKIAGSVAAAVAQEKVPAMSGTQLILVGATNINPKSNMSVQEVFL
ncbi:MAG: hypothetical protein IDH49_02130 [Gammaproteobacteria bacterium]|nr:hypothetical protein [Gammaproteobacteria bacterium]